MDTGTTFAHKYREMNITDKDVWTNQVFIDLDIEENGEQYRFEGVYTCGKLENYDIYDDNMNTPDPELCDAIHAHVEKYLHTVNENVDRYYTPFDELIDRIHYEG